MLYREGSEYLRTQKTSSTLWNLDARTQVASVRTWVGAIHKALLSNQKQLRRSRSTWQDSQWVTSWHDRWSWRGQMDRLCISVGVRVWLLRDKDTGDVSKSTSRDVNWERYSQPTMSHSCVTSTRRCLDRGIIFLGETPSPPPTHEKGDSVAWHATLWTTRTPRMHEKRLCVHLIRVTTTHHTHVHTTTTRPLEVILSKSFSRFHIDSRHTQNTKNLGFDWRLRYPAVYEPSVFENCDPAASSDKHLKKTNMYKSWKLFQALKKTINLFAAGHANKIQNPGRVNVTSLLLHAWNIYIYIYCSIHQTSHSSESLSLHHPTINEIRFFVVFGREWNDERKDLISVVLLVRSWDVKNTIRDLMCSMNFFCQSSTLMTFIFSSLCKYLMFAERLRVRFCSAHLSAMIWHSQRLREVEQDPKGR